MVSVSGPFATTSRSRLSHPSFIFHHTTFMSTPLSEPSSSSVRALVVEGVSVRDSDVHDGRVSVEWLVRRDFVFHSVSAIDDLPDVRWWPMIWTNHLCRFPFNVGVCGDTAFFGGTCS
jgi:hypothetical protein